MTIAEIVCVFFDPVTSFNSVLHIAEYRVSQEIIGGKVKIMVTLPGIAAKPTDALSYPTNVATCRQ